MEALSQVLPVVIYLLLIVFLVVLIILSIKFIITMNKVENLVDDVQQKVATFDRAFDVANIITNKFSMITDAAITFVSGIVNKIFAKKNMKNEEEI